MIGQNTRGVTRVTGRSGQLYPSLCERELLSSDRTLTSVRSAPTGRVRSRKPLYETSLEWTGRRHPSVRCSSTHRLVCTRRLQLIDRTLTSVRSAPTGRVRSRKSLSRTSLEWTGRRHPNVRCSSTQCPVSTRRLQLIK